MTLNTIFSVVTNEPVEFEKQLVEVQGFSKITDHFKGICAIYLKLIKKPKRSQHVTSWSWKHYRILNDYAQKSPWTLLTNVLNWT